MLASNGGEIGNGIGAMWPNARRSVGAVRADPPHTISPLLPEPGSVYGYTPSYVDIETSGFWAHTIDGIVVTVAGGLIGVTAVAVAAYQRRK